MSREYSSASSSRYSDSVPPSPAISPAPVASFTAGLEHQLSPSLGPLRIESTTGSKTTVIKPDKKKKGKASSSSAFTGGISSEDIFGSTTDSNDDALSDAPSRASSRRSRTFSISSRSKGKKPEGISPNDVFGQRSTSPTSPRVPSLSNMLSGLRKQTSRSNSQTSFRTGDNLSRASSRASLSGASLSASASEHESVLSDRGSRPTSSNGRRKNRFSDVLKRKTDADRAEEEEHLRILSELRLKALALASGQDNDTSNRISSSSSSSALAAHANERANAELLVRDMERQRLSRADTVSSTYSNSSNFERIDNDDTLTSPNVQKRMSNTSSLSSINDTQTYQSSLPVNGLLYVSDRPSADVPLDADGSDEESNARKSFAAIGRRATLMPTSSQSSLSDAEDIPMSSTSQHFRHHEELGEDEDRKRRANVISEDRRRSTLTPAHVSLPSSDHTKTHKSQKRNSRDMGPLEGTEADIEDEENPLTSSVLDRRRSTIKAGQMADGGIKKSRSKSSLKRPG